MTTLETTTPASADRPALPPNHHGAARPGSGILGYLSGLTMVIGRQRDSELVTRMAEIDETDHVVDIGCGPGTAARTAVRTGARVTGVDPSRPMLRLGRLFTRLRPGTSAMRCLHGEAEQLPLPSESSTVCWSLASVHHWRDLDAAIAEVSRVLRPAGRFIALERRTSVGASGLASHGWTRDQAERFAAMLTDAGFLGVQVRDHDLGRRRLVSVSATKPARRAADRIDDPDAVECDEIASLAATGAESCSGGRN